MKSQTKRELLTLALGLMFPFLLGIMLFVIWLYQAPQTSSFVSAANCLRMFLHDTVFLTAIRNTVLISVIPLLAGTLVGKLLSMLLVKKGKAAGIMSLVVLSVLLGVIFFTLIIPIWQGDSLSALFRLHIIPPEEGFTDAYISKSVCFTMVAMFLAALSCCYGVFYLAGRFHIGGFYRILLNLAGILAAQFFVVSLNEAFTALVGFPAAAYASHTVVVRIADFKAMPALGLLSISGWLFNLSFIFLLTLLLWAFERWHLRKA